jgi:hypothetical protein
MFVNKVGNGAIDHAVWGRPEDMNMARPAYKCTASNGGCSDVEGITVAALASASMAYKSTGGLNTYSAFNNT